MFILTIRYTTGGEWGSDCYDHVDTYVGETKELLLDVVDKKKRIEDYTIKEIPTVKTVEKVSEMFSSCSE